MNTILLSVDKAYMRKKIILKVFRYYIHWEKRFNGKSSLVETILIIVITAAITFKFKQEIESRFFDRGPAGYIIYDYVEPQIPLPIHEHLKKYDD